MSEMKAAVRPASRKRTARMVGSEWEAEANVSPIAKAIRESVSRDLLAG